MLIDKILNFCDSEYKREHTGVRCENCQHDGMCSGKCKGCLEEIHYPTRHPAGKKTYDCPNLINFYVCDYTYKYATEIYYLMQKSTALTYIPNYRVFSIGCGACPDLMAFEAYIKKNNLNSKIEYRGIDKNTLWTPVHNQVQQYSTDIIDHVNLSIEDAFEFFEAYTVEGINVVVLQYIISALYLSDGASAVDKLFDLIVDSIVKFKDDSEPFVILINDVNSNNMGRDLFVNLIEKLRLSGVKGRYSQYYFDRNIKNDAQRYGNKHEKDIAMSPQMAHKYSEYEPWEYCTSAQLLIEIGGNDE